MIQSTTSAHCVQRAAETTDTTPSAALQLLVDEQQVPHHWEQLKETLQEESKQRQDGERGELRLRVKEGKGERDFYEKTECLNPEQIKKVKNAAKGDCACRKCEKNPTWTRH